MSRAITRVAVIVRDYDEAIDYYTASLGFELLEDTALGSGKRWVVVAPRATSGTALVLARATNPEQESRIGNQTGGRVFLFLHTDDFDRDYALMKARGVRFTEEPRRESFGTAVVFEDLYGNRWNLVQIEHTREKLMARSQDRVECRTPTPGKQPTRIHRWKFDVVRRAILDVLPRKGDGVLFTDLTGLVKAELSQDDLAELGAPMWYVTTVKLELEVRGEIRRVKDVTPQRLLRAR